MNITIPTDLRGHPIQTLAPEVTAVLGFSATTTRVALPTGTEVVRVAPTQDCYIEFGDGTVTASGASIFMPKGSEIFRVPADATHLAAIQSTAGGQVTLTRMI